MPSLNSIMKSEKMLEVCPICGSADLYYEAGGYTGKIYHCKNCEYVGALIVEADEEMVKAIKDDYENRRNGNKPKIVTINSLIYLK